MKMNSCYNANGFCEDNNMSYTIDGWFIFWEEVGDTDEPGLSFHSKVSGDDYCSAGYNQLKAANGDYSFIPGYLKNDTENCKKAIEDFLEDVEYYLAHEPYGMLIDGWQPDPALNLNIILKIRSERAGASFIDRQTSHPNEPYLSILYPSKRDDFHVSYDQLVAANGDYSFIPDYSKFAEQCKEHIKDFLSRINRELKLDPDGEPGLGGWKPKNKMPEKIIKIPGIKIVWEKTSEIKNVEQNDQYLHFKYSSGREGFYASYKQLDAAEGDYSFIPEYSKDNAEMMKECINNFLDDVNYCRYSHSKLRPWGRPITFDTKEDE